ncbi:MAG: NepR family anti-sigma factor [Hyphomicrobiales bacterium]
MTNQSKSLTIQEHGYDASGGLDPNGQISRKLREFYLSVQEEAIPDRFLDLLERLDEAERAQADATGASGPDGAGLRP